MAAKEDMSYGTGGRGVLPPLERKNEVLSRGRTDSLSIGVSYVLLPVS
jgi:hypothetical protein